MREKDKSVNLNGIGACSARHLAMMRVLLASIVVMLLLGAALMSPSRIFAVETEPGQYAGAQTVSAQASGTQASGTQASGTQASGTTDTYTGIRKDDDGVYRLYVNGKWQKDATYIYQKRYYIKKGVWQKEFSGFYKSANDGKSYLIVNGIFQKDATYIYQKRYYVKDGTWRNTFNGFYKSERDGKSYLIVNGIFQKDANYIYKKKYYVKDGTWRDAFTGFYKSERDGNSYLIVDGIFQKSSTCMFKQGGKTYYVRDGVWRYKYSGFCTLLDGSKYLIKDGLLRNDATFLYLKDELRYYLKNGVWQKDFTGLYTSAQDGGKYYIKDGIWQKGVTTIYSAGPDEHYYIVNGRWADATEYFEDGSKTYYIEEGRAKTGVFQIEEDYYFGYHNTGNIRKKQGFVIEEDKSYYVGEEAKLLRKKAFEEDGEYYGAAEDATVCKYTNSELISGTVKAWGYESRRGTPVRKITIHHMAGVLSAKNCGEYFRTTREAVSSNYGIGYEGEIYLYVDEKERSWCSGSLENDLQSINIEVSNIEKGGEWPISDASMESLVALCVDICYRNNIEALNFTGDVDGNLTMHKWFMDTNCPGPYLEERFPWIAEEVNRRLAIKRGNIQ